MDISVEKVLNAPINRLETLKSTIEKLPCITEDLPGTGGRLKVTPEHFQVEEVLPYAPAGVGEHVFVTLKRTGWNTVDVAQAISRHLGLEISRIGWGGRKDKHAVTTQTFSLQISEKIPLKEIQGQLAELPFEIIAAKRHGNKLKIGHVKENRFRIVLSGCGDGAQERAQIIRRRLAATGVPNFFGEQRFGEQGHNMDKGIALFSRPFRSRRKSEKFTVSVVQSALFNAWLKHRIAGGDFNRIISGDIAKKTDTGGLFTVSDVHEANERFATKAIIYTGPIYGYKMMATADAAGAIESELLGGFGLKPEDFKRFRSPGSRRPALLHLSDLTVTSDPEGLVFSFTLPAGAYATIVLREFMK